MTTTQLLLIFVLFTALFLGVFVFFRRGSRSGSSLRDIGRYDDEQEEDEEELEAREAEAKAERWKKNKKGRRKEPTINEKLFMAGRFYGSERADFQRKRKLAPLVLGGLGCVAGVSFGSLQMALLSSLIGVLLGLYLPLYVLNKWVTEQHVEISYYLPLVIEQIAIGVSSSLDIGPCLSKIVEMADERNSHNAVTRLLKHALMDIKSGASLEEALSEVGRSAGHPEFKHSALALSQVAKFGGEISKQLQDLADSVATQREAGIEGMIKKLEIKATGPVGLIFVAYMSLIFLGIAASVLKNI